MTAPLADPTPTDERFVFVPLSIRRAHRDWSAEEHAAWLDLYLASYEVDGIFDSPEVARAYLGPRADALGGLMAREAFMEVDGTWCLVDYQVRYDRRRPRHHRSLQEHLASAAAKQARGEPLTGIERWARWKARSQGAELPDLRRRRRGNQFEDDVEVEKEEEEEVDTANVGPTLGRPQFQSGPDSIAIEMRKARAHIALFNEGKAGPAILSQLDPDHAEPLAEKVASEWNLEGGAA